MSDPHGHDHAHLSEPDEDSSPSRYQAMEIAVRELLIEKGVLTADEIRRQIERMDGAHAGRGGAVVARAWVDPAFKARVLADGTAACRELGLEVGALKLIVVENTAQLHNLIVCTLCSCYPWAVLGLPPSWYKSPAYRARIVREPRAVLAEFGLELPDGTEIRVWDANSETRYLVLPLRAEGTGEMDEDELASLITRNGLIGTASR